MRIKRRGVDGVPKPVVKLPEPLDPAEVQAKRMQAKIDKMNQARAAKAQAAKSPTGPSAPNKGGIRPRSNTASVSRGTLLEIERRLRLCQDHTVIEEEMSQLAGVHRRVVRTWIGMVYQEWERVAKEHRPHARQRIRAAFEKFYQDAMTGDSLKGPDFKAALQALDRLARIDGAYEPDRLVIDTGTPFKTVDTFRARMLQLIRRPDVQTQLAKQGIKIGLEGDDDERGNSANAGPGSGGSSSDGPSDGSVTPHDHDGGAGAPDGPFDEDPGLRPADVAPEPTGDDPSGDSPDRWGPGL